MLYRRISGFQAVTLFGILSLLCSDVTFASLVHCHQSVKLTREIIQVVPIQFKGLIGALRRGVQA